MIILVRSWLLLLAAFICYNSLARAQHMNYAGAPCRNVAITIAILHGYGYRNVPARRACVIHVLGSGEGVVTNEGCKQQQPGADKNDHACTIAEPSVSVARFGYTKERNFGSEARCKTH